MPKPYEKRAGGLTIVTRRAKVLLALHQRPQSAATLSEVTGLSVPAVSAALAVLVHHKRALSRAGEMGFGTASNPGTAALIAYLKAWGVVE